MALPIYATPSPNTPAFSDLSGYNTAYGSLLQQLQGLHSDSTQAEQQVKQRLGDVTNQFVSQFTNMVGRAPNQDEINQFLSQNAGSTISNSANGLGRSETDPTFVQNQLSNYIGTNFQKAANDYAVQQLQDQTSQANSLGDLYQNQGNAAISDTEKSLLDYQQKLFDRLRPNLMTSLQSQGLLNTGGMNEAVAGVQGDLANQASNYIAQLKLQNDQNANQIRFSGASAPYTYRQSLITNQPQVMAAQGQNALGFNNNLFNSNLDYLHQLGLIQARGNVAQQLQPSFMRTLGQNFASDLGSTLGTNVGNQVIPSGGGSGPTGLMKLLG